MFVSEMGSGHHDFGDPRKQSMQALNGLIAVFLIQFKLNVL